MPNWCRNVVFVHGAQEAVDAFASEYEEDDYQDGHGPGSALSLPKIVPDPSEAELAEMLKAAPAEGRLLAMAALQNAGFQLNLLDWRGTVGWGTEWEVEARRRPLPPVAGRAAVRYDFDSAWSPPLLAMQAASAAHPEVTVELLYQEGSNQIYGYAVARAGERVDLSLNSGDVVTALVTDTQGAPIAVVENASGDGLVETATGRTLEEVVAALSLDGMRRDPDALVVLTTWGGGDYAPDALAGLDRDRYGVLVGPGLAVLDPVRVEQGIRVVTDDLLDGWWDQSGEDWQWYAEWLPHVLAKHSSRLAQISPRRLLAASLAVCANVSPDCARQTADELLAAGVDPSPGVRLLDQMNSQGVGADAFRGEGATPVLEKYVTALLGALTPAIRE